MTETVLLLLFAALLVANVLLVLIVTAVGLSAWAILNALEPVAHPVSHPASADAPFPGTVEASADTRAAGASAYGHPEIAVLGPLEARQSAANDPAGGDPLPRRPWVSGS